MSISRVRDRIPDYAKDLRLNLGTVLTEEGAPGLKQAQIMGTALSCAFALKNQELVSAILEDAKDVLDDQTVVAAQSAAATMAMNNIYYRFLHLSKDADLVKLPAKLRMNAITQHGIDKADFELFCLAVSALAGCENCIKSHIREVKKGGINEYGIQSAARIASVLNSADQVLRSAA